MAASGLSGTVTSLNAVSGPGLACSICAARRCANPEHSHRDLAVTAHMNGGSAPGPKITRQRKFSVADLKQL